MSEEDPLEGLRVVIWVIDRIKPKLKLWIIMLGKVQQDSSLTMLIMLS